MPLAVERLGVLAHDDELRADDAVGEPLDRVEERAEVELLAGRERVQARAHRPVRGLEHAQLRLAARAQQRRVGALVELDLVAEAYALRRRSWSRARRATAIGYSFTYGMPTTPAARERPITPATATSVST